MGIKFTSKVVVKKVLIRIVISNSSYYGNGLCSGNRDIVNNRATGHRIRDKKGKGSEVEQ